MGRDPGKSDHIRQSMRPEVEERLRTINHAFYREQAQPFADSRARPQPGFATLLRFLPRPCRRLLDAGCGEGRLGRFLYEHGAIDSYTGVDFSPDLVDRARLHVKGEFFIRDLSQAGCLDGLGIFEAIACLATLQHIPARASRVRLLCEMKRHLDAGGRILLSTWQFLDSERQRRKIVPWSQAGLTNAEVEEGDYLLTWQRGGFARRYVCHIDQQEMAALAAQTGLSVVDQFRSDGKEGDLNLYSVLAHAA